MSCSSLSADDAVWRVHPSLKPAILLRTSFVLWLLLGTASKINEIKSLYIELYFKVICFYLMLVILLSLVFFIIW